MMNNIQNSLWEWQQEVFGIPNQETYYQLIMGASEEMGELCHSTLKEWQGIRTDQDHVAMAQDAIGDIVIYLMNACSYKGWDFFEIVEKIASDVMKRKREDQIAR